MRYIIYGAGAIGGVVGGRLAQAGHEVILIARGDHLTAIQRDGLRLRAPEGDVTLAIAAVEHPRSIAFRPDDGVILTMKTQDTERALLDLELTAGPDVAVVCCQNGVENERLAARRFANVYGINVAMPASFFEPGVVISEGVPLSGVLDIGHYPTGVDATTEQIAADIGRSRFLSRPTAAIMRFKYRKLVQNLPNAIEAITGERRGRSEAFARLMTRISAEAEQCFRAAALDVASADEYREQIAAHYQHTDVAGVARLGSSTFQSLVRGRPSVEVDYLNGEIALLGRLHGVPTPLNDLVRRLTNAMAALGERPGRYTVDDVEALAAAPA